MRRSSGTVPKHSTPAEGFLHRSRSPLGRVSYRRGGGPADGSPLPARFSRDLLSPIRERQLSTSWASEGSSVQLEPEGDPWAPEEEPPVPAEVAQKQRRQRRQRKAQQGESPGSWMGNRGLPGISNTAGRRHRDLKKFAAVVGPDPSPVPVPWELWVPQEVACDLGARAQLFLTKGTLAQAQRGHRLGRLGDWPF